MSTLLFAPVPPPAAKVHPTDPLKHAHTNSRHQIHVASRVASITNNVTPTTVTRTDPNSIFLPIVPVAIFLGSSSVLFADSFTFSVPPGTFRRFLGRRRGDSNDGNGTSGRTLPGTDRPSTF